MEEIISMVSNSYVPFSSLSFPYHLLFYVRELIISKIIQYVQNFVGQNAQAMRNNVQLSSVIRVCCHVLDDI
jgi:hypothetical protein